MGPGSALAEPVIGRAFARPVGSLVRDDGGMFRFKFQTADTRPHSRGTSCPSFAFRFPSKKREQGMPDARCTRGLVCKYVRKKTHTSIQVQRRQSDIPCAMVLR